ncbi:hypothetical protein BDN67DRAFT_1011054 [Paxillus ammoniavirescens]|nr:hypothetical protein BDN67DRAFT_1011054 [Paxillus ammoniavirescens]
MGELTDATNRAQGFALGFCLGKWVLSLFVFTETTTSKVSPRWFTRRPQDHFHRLFAASFWGDYPYFLPSLMVVVFAALTFAMILLFLDETSPGTVLYKPRPTMVDSEETSCGGDYSTTTSETYVPPGSNELDGSVPLKLLLVPKELVPVLCHVSVAVLQFAMITLQALFYSTPIEDCLHFGDLTVRRDAYGTVDPGK